MSETAKIAEALAAFQATMPTVGKGKTAKVEKDGRTLYTYQYADLADVSAVAMPLLTEQGLSFSCLPEVTERGVVLTGVLLHTSGESLRGSLPIQGSNRPQDVGSAITYARRYLFGCMTGLVTEADDDGAGAQRASKRAERKAERVSAPQQDAWTTEPGDPKMALPMSDKARATMFALFGEQKITDEGKQRAGISQIIGRPIASRGELTESECQAVIKALRSRPKPAPEVTP